MTRPPRSSPAAATFDLRRLIHPIEPGTFKTKYFEKRHLVIRRNNPHYYDGLFSLSDADRLLSHSPIRSPEFRILHQGKDVAIQSLATGWMSGNPGVLEALYDEYRHGATIVLQFLQERWEPLRLLCQSLGAEFSAPLQVNAYLTPSDERGLNTHYDTHDVFVLQTEGTKHWRLYEGSTILPLKEQPYDSATMKPGELLEEVDLQPGDLIYMPRGCPHDAASRDSASLHLTVGINSITWSTLVLRAVGASIARDSRFRESLPVGFARSPEVQKEAARHLIELLAALGDLTEPAPLIRDAAQAVLLGGQSMLDGHLVDLEGLNQVGLQTRLKRRPEARFQLSVTEDSVSLYFFGKSVRFPAHVEPDLRFIAKSDEFIPADLPGELDDPGKLVLVRTLVREGFLTIRRDGSSTDK